MSYEKKLCAMCLEEFTPVVRHQSFCCDNHRYAAWKRTRSAKPRVAKDYKPRTTKKELDASSEPGPVIAPRKAKIRLYQARKQRDQQQMDR